MQWCRDTIDYVNCANQYLLNCNISSLKNEADQLQSFIDYITKSSNVHCPGGIIGCENNTNDVRCRLGLRYFMGETAFKENGATRLFFKINQEYFIMFFIINKLIWKFSADYYLSF